LPANSRLAAAVEESAVEGTVVAEVMAVVAEVAAFSSHHFAA